MLGPIICHTIRPLVFRAGLWTIEVEKSWAHLFDMVATLMKRGYPEVCYKSIKLQYTTGLAATFKEETTIFADQNPLTTQFYLLLAESLL